MLSLLLSSCLTDNISMLQSLLSPRSSLSMSHSVSTSRFSLNRHTAFVTVQLFYYHYRHVHCYSPAASCNPLTFVQQLHSQSQRVLCSVVPLLYSRYVVQRAHLCYSGMVAVDWLARSTVVLERGRRALLDLMSDDHLLLRLHHVARGRGGR